MRHQFSSLWSNASRKVMVATLVALTALVPFAGNKAGLGHIQTASADIGPCPANSASGNSGRAIAATSHNSAGTLFLCTERLYDPNRDDYFNSYWAAWAKGSQCEAAETVALDTQVESGPSAGWYDVNQCATAGGYSIGDTSNPNTCGAATAQFFWNAAYYTWYTPEPAGTWKCP